MKGILIGLCIGGIGVIFAAVIGVLAAAIYLDGKPSDIFSLFGLMALVGSVITIGSGMCIGRRDT